MELTIGSLKGKTVEELEGVLEDSFSEMEKKFGNDYFENEKGKYNDYSEEYRSIYNNPDIGKNEKEKAKNGYEENLKGILIDFINNSQKRDELFDYIEQIKSEIDKDIYKKDKDAYAKFLDVEKDNIGKINDFNEENPIAPDELNKSLDEMKYFKENIGIITGKIYNFVVTEKSVKEKLEKLGKNKLVSKKIHDKFKSESEEASKNFYPLFKHYNYDTANKLINQMTELEKILNNLLSSESKSFKELNEEKLAECVTKKDKVKNYIKTKIGNARYFEVKINSYLDSNKNGSEGKYVIPLNEMKEIYGSKGALMMICRLEDGSVGKKKLSSNYRKICKKIRQSYKALKVDAATAALEKDGNNFARAQKDNAKLNQMLSNLSGQLNGVNLDAYKSSLANAARKKSLPSRFFSGIKSKIAKLKNSKEAKKPDCKELINNIVKEIRKVEDDLSLNSSENYIKAYNDFVNGSGKLAVKYLQKEGEKKVKRLGKAKRTEYKDKGKEYYAIDSCKLALMCLVAVCSKEKSTYEYGKDYFDKKVKEYLKDMIG